jgi:hypothetical protein
MERADPKLPDIRIPAHDARVSVLRAAMLVGMVSALGGIVGGEAADTLCTGEVTFLIVVVALSLAERILIKPLEELLSEPFGLRSRGRPVAGLFIMAFVVALGFWIDKLYYENPVQAVLVTLQSMIVPTIMTYAWIVGARCGPREAPRRGALAGTLLGLCLGVLLVFGQCAVSPVSPDRPLGFGCLLPANSLIVRQLEPQILAGTGSQPGGLTGSQPGGGTGSQPGGSTGSQPSAATDSTAGTLIEFPIRSVVVIVYLVLVSLILALLLGLSGLAGILVDAWWTSRPRRGLALAAIAATIPVLLIVWLNPPENLCIAVGASLGGMLGWAGAFYLHLAGSKMKCNTEG